MLKKKIILAGIVSSISAFKFWPGSLNRFVDQSPIILGHNNIATSPKVDFKYPSQFRCDLAKPLDPSGDGLYSSDDLFSTEEAIETLIARHKPLVKIESVCYDDLGGFDEDIRWEPFYNISQVLEEKYPLMSVPLVNSSIAQYCRKFIKTSAKIVTATRKGLTRQSTDLVLFTHSRVQILRSDQSFLQPTRMWFLLQRKPKKSGNIRHLAHITIEEPDTSMVVVLRTISQPSQRS